MEKFWPSTCFCARSMARGHHAVLDGDAFFHAEALHEARDAVRPEDPHQVVFERQVEPRRARVALAAGAAAQLIVDAPRLVALGADDVEPAERDHPLVFRFALRLEMRRRRSQSGRRTR